MLNGFLIKFFFFEPITISHIRDLAEKAERKREWAKEITKDSLGEMESKEPRGERGDRAQRVRESWRLKWRMVRFNWDSLGFSSNGVFCTLFFFFKFWPESADSVCFSGFARYRPIWPKSVQISPSRHESQNQKKKKKKDAAPTRRQRRHSRVTVSDVGVAAVLPHPSLWN